MARRREDGRLVLQLDAALLSDHEVRDYRVYQIGVKGYKAATANAVLGENGDPGESARIYAEWDPAVHQQGQATRAAELANAALTTAQAAGDQRGLAQASQCPGASWPAPRETPARLSASSR
jgi:hypothetical protein